VSRREQIKMSGAQLAAFLDEERTVICATLGQKKGRRMPTTSLNFSMTIKLEKDNNLLLETS